MPDEKQVVRECVEKIVELFKGEVPADFRYNGQTFEQRTENWMLHVIDELDRELDCDDDDDDDGDDLYDELYGDDDDDT